MFKKMYLGIEIAHDYLRAIDINGSIVIDEPLDYAPWNSETGFLKAIDYCLSKEHKAFRKMNLFLSTPIEEFSNTESLRKIVSKDKRVSSITIIGNIIAAALGTLSSGIKLLGPGEFEKKLYIYSQKYATYFSLIWSGSVVEFLKIDKGYDEVNKIILSKGLFDLLTKVPVHVPKQYSSNPNMQSYLKFWNEEIKTVYISIPDLKRFSLEKRIDKYEVIYTNYSEFLITNGLKKIIDEMRMEVEYDRRH
ncbi:hypothetical protein DesLBE_2447 [Desulfitobacterium sp. LBE]|uniref:Uncharacterized protein n=5 Tax=root TaxID=1 RepID=Q24P70_DESHY|nr:MULTISPECIES: hypothetical protein [Desulfitobacterium]ACL19011.1 hypothetical protein Dhaf_0948 [Desulfitobacterium hafniense DCB-2]EHL09228.1 hypothetical protein HMPREF0322_00110 [Desulfitobacterium hafniense DP7]KTE92773.1 hypothetical protein AT727_17780 [Desulfitobacterium hafniense]MEA5025110.1 hypothetical protein [Desulfitobacterium hafniense]TWH58140.1 hypothetical protein DesLBE_2447 [Desulfitobacterium sp. LBE]